MELCRGLIGLGAEVDQTNLGPGLTALHAAAGAGAVEVVGLLLESGSDPNKRSEREGW